MESNKRLALRDECGIITPRLGSTNLPDDIIFPVVLAVYPERPFIALTSKAFECYFAPPGVTSNFDQHTYTLWERHMYRLECTQCDDKCYGGGNACFHLFKLTNNRLNFETRKNAYKLDHRKIGRPPTCDPPMPNSLRSFRMFKHLVTMLHGTGTFGANNPRLKVLPVDHDQSLYPNLRWLLIDLRGSIVATEGGREVTIKFSFHYASAGFYFAAKLCKLTSTKLTSTILSNDAWMVASRPSDPFAISEYFVASLRDGFYSIGDYFKHLFLHPSTGKLWTSFGGYNSDRWHLPIDAYTAEHRQTMYESAKVYHEPRHLRRCLYRGPVI
jgi:hypothetical protein